MKLLTAFVTLIILVDAAVYEVPTRRTESLRHRLIKSGLWRSFLRQHDALRVQGLHKLVDYFDDFYLANVSFGTPPQSFEIVPDTGSASVWIIGTECTSQACYGQGPYTKDRFDASASRTFRKTDRVFRIQYGSGNAVGYIGFDAISFASLHYPTQRFGVAIAISAAFGYQPIEGIFGLGWPSLTSSENVPPMQNVMSQLDLPLFTVFFARNVGYSSSALYGGVITYGGLDKTRCSSQIYYVPLSAQSYWQFTMNGVSLGSYSMTGNQEAISDTGTSWIGGPKAIIDKLTSTAGGVYDDGDQFYKISCSRMDNNPDLVFKINGRNYAIPSIQYILDLDLGNNQCAMTFFSVDYSGFGPQWILGATLIRAYCQVYDFGNAQLGFAKSLQVV